jgi:large subunit ribosomal protein L2
LTLGDIIKNHKHSRENSILGPGDSAYLQDIPSGRLIHNINGKYTRAAGASTILIRKDLDQALIKFKSGEIRFFHTQIRASLGLVGNENHFLRTMKYAGLIRIMGRRPRVRPSAMNPVTILWEAVQRRYSAYQ